MVLNRLGFTNLTISLNHRDLLYGLIEVSGISAVKEQAALVAIDPAGHAGQREGQDERNPLCLHLALPTSDR